MKCLMILTGDGALVILTSFASPSDPVLLKKLEAKGITKFIAHEIRLETAKERYGQHFTVVANDLHETDDLRVLDYSGGRAFNLFSFAELGPPMHYEGGTLTTPHVAHVRGSEDTQ